MLPAAFIKFWTNNKHLTLGQAVQTWNSAGFSPRIVLAAEK